MRVFHIISGFENGGVETLIYRLISAMPQDIEFHIVAHDIAVPACAARFERLGVAIHIVPCRKKLLAHKKALLALFCTYHPDVVHVHTTEWGGIALSVAQKAGIACRIQHSHAARQEKNPVVRLLHKLLFWRARRAATHLFACGSAAAHLSFGKGAVEKGEVKLIKNGIDLGVFAYREEARKDARVALDVAEDAVLVGMVARFSPQKNHIVALSIFEEYFKKNPKAVLLLVGDGPLRASVETLARKILPEEAVRFLGVRSDMPALYAAMDRFILPSRFEGLPITLIEAQAAGLPAVVSDTVTREADFSGRVSYISNQEISKWVMALSAPAVGRRTGYGALAAAHGYQLADVAADLYDFYKKHA